MFKPFIVLFVILLSFSPPSNMDSPNTYSYNVRLIRVYGEKPILYIQKEL